MVTLAVVGSATESISQIQAAKQQTKAINSQLAVQQKEIRTAEIAEINDRQRVAQQEQARIKVAAGQAGLNISGSTLALIKDSGMQNTLARERTRLNAESAQNAALAEANGMHQRNLSPSILGVGMRLAMAGGQAYYGGKSIRIGQNNASKGPQ